MLTGSIVTPLVGGAIIGTAATLLLATLGRVAGISGILATALRSAGKVTWQQGFVVGLVLVGVLVGKPATSVAVVPPALAIGAGLLVGFGTRLGNGCTSGHGVCGIARFSKRSIAATAVFVAAGVVVVSLVRHVLVGAAP